MSQAKSKKERREASRQARIEAARAKARARKRKQASLIAILVVVAIAAGYLLFKSQADKGAAVKAAMQEAGCTEIKEIEELSGSPHITDKDPQPKYNSNPPTSGLHFGTTAEWGVADENIDDRTLVHNLEHGGVIVHYKADEVDEEDLQEVEDYVGDIVVDPATQSGVIIQPNPGIKHNVALASWGHLQTCKELSLEIVKAYVDEECGKGPEPFTCAPGAK